MASTYLSQAPRLVAKWKTFGGMLARYQHFSEVTQTEMGFAVFLPTSTLGLPGIPVPQGTTSGNPTTKFPTLYWLSGLTCDDTNFIMKAGAQAHLAQQHLMVVCPDTSPRGLNLPGEKDSWDFGVGAGFYLNATTPTFAKNYRMYDYVSKELPLYIEHHFPSDPSLKSIFGHSMGGLGALNIFLKNPGKYKSVSAFSPICNPMKCKWGEKAFTGYLGEDKDDWKAWDPSELLRTSSSKDLPTILVSQGSADDFLAQGQLLPESIASHPNVQYELHEGYDHSYYFISTFVQQHIEHHASFLRAESSSK